MSNPEHREQSGEVNKSKKPLKGSVFDRPGPLFPGFEKSRTPNFEEEMRINRRTLFGLGIITGLGLVAAAFCGGNKKK